jgi:hypothetical protein
LPRRPIQVNRAPPTLGSVDRVADALPGRPSPLGARPLLDDDFLVLVNAWWEPLEFTVGDCRPGLAWRAEIDTFDPTAAAAVPVCRAGDRVTVGPRSVLVLRGPRMSSGL